MEKLKQSLSEAKSSLRSGHIRVELEKKEIN
jgi:hypothetical protein